MSRFDPGSCDCAFAFAFCSSAFALKLVGPEPEPFRLRLRLDVEPRLLRLREEVLDLSPGLDRERSNLPPPIIAVVERLLAPSASTSMAVSGRRQPAMPLIVTETVSPNGGRADSIPPLSLLSSLLTSPSEASIKGFSIFIVAPYHTEVLQGACSKWGHKCHPWRNPSPGEG